LAITLRPVMPSTRSQSLGDVAYQQMLSMILDGTWPPRSRLPSEADLAVQLGVSRPVVRQALARLRDGGLIASRQGSGSFVQEQGPERTQVLFPPITSVADLERCLSFREGVEGEAAAAAALHRTEARIAELRAAIGSQGSGVLLSSDDDFAFHLTVARASENPFYINTLSSLKDQVLFGMNLSRSFSGTNAGVIAETIRAQHEAIAEAIIARDASKAREQMRLHLDWVRRRLLMGTEASANV
jgi:GntR family transcriptional repressor for pyruvate dehydrogenase complex